MSKKKTSGQDRGGDENKRRNEAPQKHEDRQNPASDHPTGHFGYSRDENLAVPRTENIDDERKQGQR